MKKIVVLLAAIFAVTLFAADGKIRVYVTRHGQPGRPGLEPGDVVPLPGIRNDPPLTKLGQKQAHYLGKFLKEQGFKGKIFASPYLRSVDTAVCVAKECGVKVCPHALFQERVRKAGKSNLKKPYVLAEFKQLFPGMISDDCELADNWAIVPDKPEGYKEEHKDRLMKGLDEAMKKYPGEDILVAGHGGTFIGFIAGFEERMGKKIKRGTGWNCALMAWDIDIKTGEVTYVGYRVDYIPKELVTSNEKKVNPKKVERDHKPDWSTK